MFVASIILGIVSVVFLSIWIHALTGMFRDKKLEIRKIDRTIREKRSASWIGGFSKEVSVVREKGFEVSAGGEMSYDELADGVKRKDPAAFLFIRIAGGFGIGLLSGIAAIGSFVVSRGNNDGWAMIITAMVFFSIFGYIVASQAVKRHRRKQTENRPV